MTAILRAATLGLLAAGLVSAEMPLPGAEPLVTGMEGFEALDEDGSGSISRDEAASLESLEAAFDDHDVDGDGQLSAEEYQAALTGGIQTADEDG